MCIFDMVFILHRLTRTRDLGLGRTNINQLRPTHRSNTVIDAMEGTHHTTSTQFDVRDTQNISYSMLANQCNTTDEIIHILICVA